ncbi:MAG: N-acetyltransferase family protein [Kineosporiaceae bacterium]
MASGIGTGGVLAPTAADASVRPARPADAGAIGAVQARAWRLAFAAVIADDALDQTLIAQSWRQAVTHPPSPRHAVLVATSGGVVVGFVAIAPAADPDLTGVVDEIVVLAVDPPHQRAGHGSRLLSAGTAAMRDHGATGVVAWLPLPDAVTGNFLASAGMVTDGARRTLAAPDGGTVTQLRLTAAFA